MGYSATDKTRIARLSYSSVSFCICVSALGGVPMPSKRLKVPFRARNLLSFQPSMTTLTPISHRMIVDACPVSAKLRKMTSWHTKLDHCDRTERPSRLDFFFQKPMSCRNARNANHECRIEIENVNASHFQSVPVTISFISSKSDSVMPNVSVIMVSECVIWFMRRKSPMFMALTLTSSSGSSRRTSELSTRYSRRVMLTSSTASSGRYAC
mmetsp:Transcript_38253/g.95059  ORF Transcript_38253/g.95059 Transcript_38253/m.95059 type:complete len:211 (-) Transcript_38253:239-871(-)